MSPFLANYLIKCFLRSTQPQKGTDIGSICNISTDCIIREMSFSLRDWSWMNTVAFHYLSNFSQMRAGLSNAAEETF